MAVQVSNASILDYEEVTGKDGKPHYNLHVLTRSGKLSLGQTDRSSSHL